MNFVFRFPQSHCDVPYPTMFCRIVKGFLQNSKEAKRNIRRQRARHILGLKINFHVLLLTEFFAETSHRYPPVVFTLFDSRCSVRFVFALYFAIRLSPVLKLRLACQFWQLMHVQSWIIVLRHGPRHARRGCAFPGGVAWKNY
jgi:hypothetical protein